MQPTYYHVPSINNTNPTYTTQPQAPPPQHNVIINPFNELTDSMFAMKLSETELETHRRLQKQEKEDEVFAAKLQELERLNDVQRKSEEKIKEEEKRKRKEREDLENRKKQQLRADEDMARKLVEEEKKQLQIEKDKALAKKLEDEEKKRSVYVPPVYVPPVYNPVSTYPNYNYQYKKKSQQRQHALNIHNRYCGCNQTQTCHNNHVYKIHATSCGCNLDTYSPIPSNEGRAHVHGSKCCVLDHLHNVNCYCSFRNHAHTFNCCPKNHIHSDYCHCANKF